LIGYAVGAALVKEALARDITIRELALEKAARGELKKLGSEEKVRGEEIEAVLGDLRRFTDGGLLGSGGGGG